ncbi:EAL domain-containing protein [Halobacillus fulvus]|nr:EAL domain-containing protein [Halobacillus fulvus]
MMGQLSFLLFSTISCTILLKIIILTTRINTNKKHNEIFLSCLLASLAGLTLTLVPTLSLYFQQGASWTTANLSIIFFCGFSLTLLLFLTFIAMSYVGKRKVQADPLQSNIARIHFILSTVVALLILSFTYVFVTLHSEAAQLTKENFFLSMLLLIGVIYSTTRIFERIHIDEMITKKSVSPLKSSLLFGLISLSLSSNVFLFIEQLFARSDFFIMTLSMTTVFLLLFITIAYIESQFVEQQDKLEENHNRLEIQEQRYRSLFDFNPNAVLTFDLEGNFTACNQSALLLTGYTRSELLNLKIPNLIVASELDKTIAAYEKVRIGGTADFESKIMSKYNDVFHIRVTAFAVKVNDELTGVHAIAQDITAEKQANDKIEFLAYHDELTGLLNRRGMNTLLESTVNMGTSQMAMILFDIDQFKNINDHLGHTVGDRLLQQVGDRLKLTLQEKGFTARIGGDEFLICLPDYEAKSEIIEEIKTIQSEMGKLFVLGEFYKHITISIGVSYYPEDGKDFNTLIRHADMAMYEVKRHGRNSYKEFSTSYEKENVSKIILLEELKEALDKNQFVLHYQPKYNLSTNRMEGAEALIRWAHPERGLISPERFIPLAEQEDLIFPIGDWTLKEACRQFMEWKLLYNSPFHISVNVSAKQFLHPDFMKSVMDALDAVHMRPEDLDIEITETIAIENTKETHKKINTLKELGVQITMDDFGTGYTSLSYLSMFTIDRIKIDRSFITGMMQNKNHAIIAQTIISVAKNLNMSVTAEGVETEDQLSLLKSWDCDEGQGYLFGRPQPADLFLHSEPFEPLLSVNAEDTSFS